MNQMLRDASRSDRELELAEIRDVRRLSSLRSSWLELWQRCASATVFQRPEWVLAWCEHMLGGEPLAVALTHGERLVGLLPWFVWSDRSKATLSVMGAGVSDYQDVLIEPAFLATSKLRLERWLEQTDVARCEWSELVPDSILGTLTAPPGAHVELEPQEPCPAVELPHSVEGLAQVISTRLDSNLRKARRSLERRAQVSFELATEETFDHTFDTLVRFYGQRRAARGELNPLGDPRALGFQRAAARALLGQRAATLHCVRVDGELVSVVYGLLDRGATRLYMAGFDPRYMKESVGGLTLAYALERAVLRGDRWLDFLRGGEAYKYHWGARDRITLQRRVIVRDPARRAGAAIKTPGRPG